MTKSINFNTGKKKYIINGDKNNYIEVTVTDPNLIGRIDNTIKAIENTINEAKTYSGVDYIIELDKKIRKIIDECFDADISDKVFGKNSCLSIVEGKKGTQPKTLCISFLEAFLPIVMQDINEATNRFVETSKEEAEKVLEEVKDIE